MQFILLLLKQEVNCMSWSWLLCLCERCKILWSTCLWLSVSACISEKPHVQTRAAPGTRYPSGTRVIYYPGNFLLPNTTRRTQVPELEKSPHMSMQILFN